MIKERLVQTERAEKVVGLLVDGRLREELLLKQNGFALGFQRVARLRIAWRLQRNCTAVSTPTRETPPSSHTRARGSLFLTHAQQRSARRHARTKTGSLLSRELLPERSRFAVVPSVAPAARHTHAQQA